MKTLFKIIASALLGITLSPLFAGQVPLQSTDKDVQEISCVIADGPEIPYWERIDSLAALSRQIGQPELLKLYAFLRSTAVPKGLHPPHVWALKNDLLNILREQDEPSQEYEPTLFDIFRNPKQDAVMRDYALQHARAWYPLSVNKSRILELLWSVAHGRDGSLPGTAILSLWGVWREFPQDVNKEELAEVALALAVDPKMHVDARISCLQICGQLGERKALPLALQIATTGKPSQMRMAAIATVGDLGDSSHQALLEKLREKGNPEVTKPVETALEKIEKRQ